METLVFKLGLKVPLVMVFTILQVRSLCTALVDGLRWWLLLLGMRRGRIRGKHTNFAPSNIPFWHLGLDSLCWLVWFQRYVRSNSFWNQWLSGDELVDGNGWRYRSFITCG